jgi:hypothetical protein
MERPRGQLEPTCITRADDTEYSIYTFSGNPEALAHARYVTQDATVYHFPEPVH